MSEKGNQNLQDAKNAVGKGSRAAGKGIRGGVKGGKALGKGASKAATALPPEVIAIIAGVLLAIVAILGIVGSLNDVQMDNNEYRTAVKEEAKNVPVDDDETYEANYNLGLAIKQTLDLSEVIHDAKKKEKESIEKKYKDKKVVCESDQTPVLINENYPEYYPTFGGAGGGGGDLVADTAAKFAAKEGSSESAYDWDYGAKPTAAAMAAAQKWHPSWTKNRGYKFACCCHSAAVILSEVCQKPISGLLPNTNSASDAKKSLEASLRGTDFEVFPFDGKGSSLQRGDVLSFCWKRPGGHVQIYMGDNKTIDGSRGRNMFSHWESHKSMDADLSDYNYFFVIRKKGGSGTGTAFQQGVVNWCKETVASGKYGYKVFENAPSNASKCPICHPGSGDGWNCIGFAWASWHHGGKIDSACWCGVLDNGTTDRMLHMSVEEASALASRKAGVEVRVIKNGGQKIPESMLQPGDILLSYTGNVSKHDMVYIGNGQYADSPGGSSLNIGKYSKEAFTTKLALRYAGAGGGSAGFTKKESFTVLEEITPSTGTRHSIGYIGSSNCAQSFAYVDNGFAVSFVTTNHAPAHVMTYDKNCKSKSSIRADAISHANAACSTPDGKYMVAGTMNPSSGTGHIFSLGDSISKDGTKSLPSTASSIAYDRETGKYILATSGSFRIYDSSLSTCEKTLSRNMHSFAFCQDIGAANGYIFACHTTIKGGENYGKNYVDIYNESNGDYCGSYYVKYGELESVDVVDGELVLLVHILGHVNYIQFTGINVGSGSAGGEISNYTTKSDLDVLAAYSVTLANTGLFKTKEVKDGENKTWFDKLESGDLGTNNYTDAKGNKLKLYWFGEKTGRVNYKSDLKKKLGEGWFRRKKVYFYEVIDDPDEAKAAMREDGVNPNATSTSQTSAGKSSKWHLILVNRKNTIDNSYSPNLSDVSSYAAYDNAKVDKRIKKNLVKMLEDCPGSPKIYSAYRTAAEQDRIYKNEPEATKNLVVPAGCSEHQTGLAVDILEEETAMDTSQENQKSQKWLMENCHKYGFILRYPKNKTSLTEVGYEPWHYRYVGKTAAKEIKEQGVCLEEYLDAVPSESELSGDIVYLRERPINDILVDMDADPDETYVDSGRESMFDASNLEAAIGMSDNTEHMLFTAYLNVDRSGATDLKNLGTGDFGLPLEKGVYTITSHVGRRNAPTAGASTNHAGVDLACPTGTPIYASLSGTATVARKVDRGGYGLYVEISSGDYTIIYGHMSQVLVNEGDTITKGQKIGLVGSTGTSTGPHLHFEVHKNGKVIDPEEFMDL